MYSPVALKCLKALDFVLKIQQYCTKNAHQFRVRQEKNHQQGDTPNIPVRDQKDENQPSSSLPVRERCCCSLSSLLRTPVSRHSPPPPFHIDSCPQLSVYKQK